MTLKSVLIKKRASYEENAGHYRQVSETLLAFIGPVISKFAHQAALELEAS